MDKLTGEGELVAGAFINKPIRSGMVVLVDVGAFEVDASKTHDLLVHLSGWSSWRKRSIPTHSEWLYPLTFDAGKGLKEA